MTEQAGGAGAVEVAEVLEAHLAGDYTHLFFDDPGSISPPVGCRCGWRRLGSHTRHVASVIASLPTVAALTAERDAARAEHRDLVSRLGFGDNITEPMADNDTVVAWYEERSREADEWRESQRWRDECALAGHSDDEDCSEHDPVARHVREAVEAALGPVSRYVELVARVHEVYRHLVMDTEEDRAIHARHIETADKALALARAAIDAQGRTAALGGEG